MHGEFLELYNRELKLLNEQAREFSEEFPGIAERLGALVGDNADPMITGLLQGAAFLAARVQLKLKHEFPEFTSNLLELLLPNALQPVPSCLLARFSPPFGDPALREGRVVPRGAIIDATYRERDRRIACRFTLSTSVTLWPFEIRAAQYHVSGGPLQAMGVPAPPQARSALVLSLVHRSAERREDEPAPQAARKQPQALVAGCRTRDLPIYLTMPEGDAVAVLEQIHARRVAVYLRHLDEFGNPVVVQLGPDCVAPLGFEEDEALLPNDPRVFGGFTLLRDYFVFPRKFLGFRVKDLDQHLAGIDAPAFDIVFAFEEPLTRLAAAVKADSFALYASPAVNLFEKTTDRIVLHSFQHEFAVTPDRSRVLDFEPHRIVSVQAHRAGAKERVPVHPLHATPPDRANDPAGLFYTVRRMPRRRSSLERGYGRPSDYVGTDMFVSLAGPGLDGEHPVVELSVKALCSNRALAEQLPLGEGGADFRLMDDVSLDIDCVAGPTKPLPPMVGQTSGRGEFPFAGDVAWRLVNLLALNHLGIAERGAGRNAQALRETLTLFGDPNDATLERRIRGIRQVDSRPVVRRLSQRTGTGAARGTQITILVEEKAFEGSGVFLLGAVLDRFLAEYASMNHFTETVLASTERGVIMRFPPRVGQRRLI
jgi:type VI secretion system protein ImpG